MFVAVVALCVRCYIPCPFWDEWALLNPIAQGAGFTSWHWLWSQHNEHRLLMTRLLILLDLRAFGGRNVSLFIEMFAAQVLHWAAICYALERFTDFPSVLKRTVEGVYGFCLFHLNQADNFTWAFQASFVIAFVLATLALLAIAFFEQWRHPMLVAVAVGLTPLAASINVSGGLVIGPVAIAFALWRRLPARYIGIIAVLFLASAAAYLADYHVPPSKLAPSAAFRHPKDLLVYMLTYFGASWTKLLPHKERPICFLSFIALAFLASLAVRRRRQTGPFEWFCLAECVLAIGVALVTALGRLQYGVGQAYAGRYQTPAMLYWASLCSLVLISTWHQRPERLLAVQASILLILVASAATLIPIWTRTAEYGDELARACYLVMHGNHDEAAAKLMYGGTRQDVAPGVEYLHRLWNK